MNRCIILLACFFVFGCDVNVSSHKFGGKCMELTSQNKWSEAHKKCKQEADAGNRSAMYELGLMYHRGDGVDINYSTAKYWYELAVDKKSPYAMHNLAIMYRDGLGVDVDIEKYVNLMQSAASQEYGPSLNEMAALYFHGNTVIKKDKSISIQFLKRAASTGIVKSMYEYGVALVQGIDGKENSDGVVWILAALRAGY